MHRLDPAKNMRRFYRLDVEQDLFGRWRLLREWGRIGCAGQSRMTAYGSAAEAEAAATRQRRAKERRGYRAL